MRIVVSLSDPYPAPIVQPASLSAPTTVFEPVPSGSFRQDTVQLRRPSRGTYGTPRCSLHASTRERIASWRRQRASTPPARSMRASCVSSAYKSEIAGVLRSEEHTSELQSQFHLVCRLLLEKKKR